MEVDVKSLGEYKVITINEALSVISELDELKGTIERMLDKKEKHIAVNFKDTSYLYSGAISVLITCYRMIRERGGSLCIIEPHTRVLDLLIQMNIDSLIDIIKSEDELLHRKANKKKSKFLV